MNTNLFYFNTLNSIGGIETFFWHIARKYGQDYDITILYRNGDPEQVKRLSRYVRVRKYRGGETVRCKRAFCAFNTDILNNIVADEYYQMLHGDYKKLGVLPDGHEKLSKWIACSKTVSDAYADVTGEVAEVCYNPYVQPDKPRKVLRLISATRLTKDKGAARMKLLSDALDAAGIPYVWDVYTDSSNDIANPNIVLHPPRLDVIDFVAAADYYVQLSDAEGYCYSVVEALSVGTPVIVTDCTVFHEIGVQDRVNGFILPMDLSNIPVEAIYKGLKKFKYTAPADKWSEYLLPVAPNYEEESKTPTMVRCKKVYWDLEEDRLMDYGEAWMVTLARAELLYDLGLVDIVEE